MDEIGKHISELLFDHDCVIVPSLGGFLASNQPSRILQPNQIIFPPYRRIAFNVYLKQNDGLLANHIAETDSVAYNEAIRLIDSFTASCFELLDSGRKVNIEEIGTLFYDKEKNLQFEANRNFNHLKDSFGMEAVHYLPLQPAEKTERRKIQAEKIQRPSLPAEEKRSRITFSKGKKYMGLAAVIAILGWFSLNLYLIAPKKYESTSLSPFDSQSIVLSNTDSIRNTPTSVQIDSEPVINPTTASTTTTEPLASANTNETNTNTEESTIIKKIPEPEPVVTQPKKTTEPVSALDGRHYIIAGVFKIRENAETTLSRLQKLGFANAQIIVANNCNYVSYESYPFRDEALSKVDSLHGKNLDGWVWKY